MDNGPTEIIEAVSWAIPPIVAKQVQDSGLSNEFILRASLFTFFFLWFCGGLWGQVIEPFAPAPNFLDPLDSVVVRHDFMSGNLVFDAAVPDGASLYALGKFYGLRLDDVYLLNPRYRLGYAPGDQVTIPLPRPALRPFIPYDSINFYAPVYYEFKRGETLYGLVHRALKLEDDQQLYLNNPGLTAQNVRVGQLLFVGWLSTAGITAEMQGELEDPYVKRNTALRQQWNRVSKGKRLKTQKGKAAWTSQGDRSKFMVLHRTAPIDGLLEIMDKRTGKTLYCRVVGRIPDQVYDRNVQVVVSPLLVKAFGVRDRFFYVQVKHY